MDHRRWSEKSPPDEEGPLNRKKKLLMSRFFFPDGRSQNREWRGPVEQPLGQGRKEVAEPKVYEVEQVQEAEEGVEDVAEGQRQDGEKEATEIDENETRET